MKRPNLKGRRVDTQLFNDLLDYIKTRINVGPDLNMTTQGDQIVISSSKKITPIGGYGDSAVPRVARLPELDTVTSASKKYEVFWLNEAQGILEGYDGSDEEHPLATGDNQVWAISYPQQVWYPTTIATDRIGIPGS
jgi:hypothetical protein